MNHSANCICYFKGKTPEAAFRSGRHFRLRLRAFFVICHSSFARPPGSWSLPLYFYPDSEGPRHTDQWFTDTGTISPAGDSDTWTFSANTGDSLIVRVEKSPKLEPLAEDSPDGIQVQSR